MSDRLEPEQIKRLLEEVISAAENGDYESMQTILSTAGNQNVKDQCCMTAAVSALEKGHLEFAKPLVQAITDQDLKQQCCLKAAERAATDNQMEILEFLVHSITDQRKKDICCLKATLSAAIWGHLESMKYLLDNIVDQKVKNACCLQVMSAAFRKEDYYRSKSVPDRNRPQPFEVVKLAVQAAADQSVKDQCCIAGAELAARWNHLDVVKFLVQTIGDQTVRDNCCSKAAVPAARFRHLRVVEFLVQSIDDVSVKEQCCTKATEFAARWRHLEVVKYLVPMITDQTVRDLCCAKAVEYPAKKGYMEVVKYLVRNIADTNTRNQCCIKSAINAARWRHANVLNFLVQSTRGKEAKEQCRMQAAESAARFRHWDTVAFMVRSISDQTVKNQCCMKIADSATKWKHWDIVKEMLLTITDQGIKDEFCMTVASGAVKGGHMEMVKFLLNTIVDPKVRDQFCMNASVCASEKDQLEVVNFLLPKITNEKLKDQCCVKAAESVVRNGQIHFLSVLSLNASEKCRSECVHFCVVSAPLGELENVGIRPEYLLSDSNRHLLEVLSISSMKGKNSILDNSLTLMKAAEITQLLSLSISAGHISLALTVLPQVDKEHIDLPDSDGTTALMLAADAGHHELIEQLLDRGASVMVEDSLGRTALSRACQAGQVRAAKTLVDRNADVNHRDRQGLTCVQLAAKHGHLQVTLLFSSEKTTSDLDDGLCAGVPSDVPYPRDDDAEDDQRVSFELHQLMSEAGFTKQRAKCQSTMADLLQGIARVITLDGRQMTGSYADGWANSLVQVNGRTAADSDIDWTVMVAGRKFHLEGSCDGKWDDCRGAEKLPVKEGHVQVLVGSGSQPAINVKACGARPAQDTCHAFKCCNIFSKEKINALIKISRRDRSHLVRATRPSASNELRVSFSFQERDIIRRLNIVQGQLFTILKFIFKRHLPRNLGVHGLKTYHAKTLLFFMMDKHGRDNEGEWQPQNLIKLLKESLDMIIKFMDDSSSPDECMPHFFMSKAPLYFKNAGIGGDFDNTKTRVRSQMTQMRSNIREAIKKLTEQLRPLQSESFFFHPFVVLPLANPPTVTEIRKKTTEQLADGYSMIYQCLIELQSDKCDSDLLMRQLNLLLQLPWCKCAAMCLTAMAHLKLGEMAEAEMRATELASCSIRCGWKPEHLLKVQYDEVSLDSDWAWRFCFPCISQPRFPYLREFTQTLFTARLSQPRSSHLYVNFRCVSWSLQAELLGNHRTSATIDAWFAELQEDPDLEELLTLAHYSDSLVHWQFCLQQMETIRDEKRVAIETLDEKKIELVKQKLQEAANAKDDEGLFILEKEVQED